MKKACTSAEIITYTYEEYDINKNGSDWVWFVIDYPKKFKEIKMVKAVNFQTVIGNSGGYVGLFLGKIISNTNIMDSLLKKLLHQHYLILYLSGFALLQLPDYIGRLHVKSNEWLKNR